MEASSIFSQGWQGDALYDAFAVQEPELIRLGRASFQLGVTSRATSIVTLYKLELEMRSRLRVYTESQRLWPCCLQQVQSCPQQV